MEALLYPQIVIQNIVDFIYRKEDIFNHHIRNWNNIPDILLYELIREYCPEMYIRRNILHRILYNDGRTEFKINNKVHQLITGSAGGDPLNLLPEAIFNRGRSRLPETNFLYEFIMRDLNILFDEKKPPSVKLEIIKKLSVKNIPYESKKKHIETELSYNRGYPGLFKSILYIISEWIWWRDFNNNPYWKHIRFFNSFSDEYAVYHIPENSAEIVLLGSQRVYLTGDKSTSANGHSRTEMIHYCVMNESIPVMLKLPGLPTGKILNTKLKQWHVLLTGSNPGTKYLVKGNIWREVEPYTVFGVKFIPLKIQDLQKVEEK